MKFNDVRFGDVLKVKGSEKRLVVTHKDKGSIHGIWLDGRVIESHSIEGTDGFPLLSELPWDLVSRNSKVIVSVS